MDDEIAVIERNNTGELTELPKGQRQFGTKWVYKTKLKENDTVGKYRHAQRLKAISKFGIDYKEIFATVARHDMTRLVIALAAHNAWPIFQLDVKSTFLHGELQEKVYIDPLRGHVKFGNEQKCIN